MQIQTCQRPQFLTAFDYSGKDLSDGDGRSGGRIVGREQLRIRKKKIVEIYLLKMMKMKTKLLAGFSLIGNSTTNFIATPFATLPYKQDRIQA